jgi:Carboxypeptidase regulatory-like domain/TonB dependent receptor
MRHAIAIAILSFFAVTGFAQNFRGEISGIVTDQSDNALPGSVVRATDNATGIAYTSASSSAGQFSFTDLPIGDYTVTITQGGFSTLEFKDIHVAAGQVYNVPARLSVASTATTVEVSAAGVALETTNTTLVSSLPTSTVQNLPMNGRDFTQMIAAVPGWAGNPTNGLAGSLNGARQNQVNWQIEGSDDNDPWWNFPATNQTGVSGIAAVVVPLDAIDEFSLVTQGGADMGRSPGGTVNLVMKSGSNQVHGSAYYYNRNEALAAASPFLPAGKKKPVMRNQQYGASVGGPIFKDKTFFFTTYEAQKYIIGLTGLYTEPSVAYQNAARSLMSSYGVPVNPVSTNLLNTLWPAYALTGPATSSNYFNTDPQQGHSHNGLVKIDHNFNERNRISARAYFAYGFQVGTIGDNIVYYYAVTPVHSQNYNVTYNTTVNAHMENQLLFGDNFFSLAKRDQNLSFNPPALGLNTGVTAANLSGAPYISIGSFDKIGSTPPSGRSSVTGTVQDALSYLKGAHQMRFGGGFMQGRIDGFYHAGARGSFTYNGSQGPWSNLIGTPGFDANLAGLADFMAGYVYQSNIAEGDPERFVTMNGFNFFAQDSWQITHKLNVNFGLRYEYVGPLHDDTKDLSVFNPNVSGGLAVAGQDISNLYQQYWKNFLPRVGFAYQPWAGGSTVVRGGFGLYTDTVAIIPFLNNSNSLASYGAPNGGPIGVNGNPAGTKPVYLVNRNGYTIVPNQLIFPSPNSIGGTNVLSLFGVDPNLRPALITAYNLNIQQALGKNIVLQVAYVGNESRHQITLLDVNQAALGSGTALTPSGFTKAQVSRPYFAKFPNFGVINTVESDGTANYNALQISLNTSMWHGLFTKVNYTWSHNNDDMTSNTGTLPQNSFDLAGNYGSSDNDRRNQFNGYASYQIPGMSHGPTWLTNGWEVNSVTGFHVGGPITLKTSSDTTGTGENVQYANYIGGSRYKSSSVAKATPVQWLNPAAFAAPAAGNYGTYRRGFVVGPGYGDVDLSFLKNIPIKERLHGQFRFEMFNIFNRTNLSGPSGTVGSSSFGQTSETVGDAGGDPGIGPGEPFNIQVALKILW